MSALDVTRPLVVEWLVYRCGKCTRLGRAKATGLLPDGWKDGKWDAKVEVLPEFRPNARDVFGWSDRDNVKKDGTL